MSGARLLSDECIMDIAPPRGVIETKLALTDLRLFERAPEIGDSFLQIIGEPAPPVTRMRLSL
jgi:hypothetical protein